MTLCYRPPRVLFVTCQPADLERFIPAPDANRVQLSTRLRSETATVSTLADLITEMKTFKPTVVHFSGHGGRRTVDVDEPGVGCLFFDGPAGQLDEVSAKRLHRSAPERWRAVELLVLNACDTQTFAREFSEVLANDPSRPGPGGCFVVCAAEGTTTNVLTARPFFDKFYEKLNDGDSLGEAYKTANALAPSPFVIEPRPSRDPDGYYPVKLRWRAKACWVVATGVILLAAGVAAGAFFPPEAEPVMGASEAGTTVASSESPNSSSPVSLSAQQSASVTASNSAPVALPPQRSHCSLCLDGSFAKPGQAKTGCGAASSADFPNCKGCTKCESCSCD